MTKPQKLLNGLSLALWDSDLVATRVLLSIGEFLWAIMLFWPVVTFNRPTYSVMFLVMSEEAWGFVLLLSAITQLTLVMSANYHHWFSRLFAAWNASLWSFLVISVLISSPSETIGGEFALALAASWIWLRPYILKDIYTKAIEEFP